MDKIFIKGLELYGYHGVNKSERTIGQRFILNITCWYNMNKICVDDKIENGVNYSDVVNVVRNVFLAGNNNTLERTAQVISDAIFKNFQNVKKTEITIEKPDAPIKANFESVGVTIEWTK